MLRLLLLGLWAISPGFMAWFLGSTFSLAISSVIYSQPKLSEVQWTSFALLGEWRPLPSWAFIPLFILRPSFPEDMGWAWYLGLLCSLTGPMVCGSWSILRRPLPYTRYPKNTNMEKKLWYGDKEKTRFEKNSPRL